MVPRSPGGCMPAGWKGSGPGGGTPPPPWTEAPETGGMDIPGGIPGGGTGGKAPGGGKPKNTGERQH